MSIRPMTNGEIAKALRRAAQVCIERSRSEWCSLDVCVADATFHAAKDMVTADDGVERDPEHAALFLLLVAEAVE